MIHRMNKNLEEIFEKIMSAVDVINEYGGYVDAYVREQDRGKKSGLNNFLEIAKMAQKKMITEENKNQYMRILDKAIKKFTEGDIIVELKTPLRNLGIDIDNFLDNLTPEIARAMFQEVYKNIDPETVKEFAQKYQEGKIYGE